MDVRMMCKVYSKQETRKPGLETRSGSHTGVPHGHARVQVSSGPGQQASPPVCRLLGALVTAAMS